MKNNAPTISTYCRFSQIATTEDWFEIYQVSDNLFVFYEPHHYERTIANLLIGHQKAVLIDTGCGIGNLRKAVDQVTQKPVVVINTHTHPDHLGGNSQFDEIAMFDHPLSRQVSEKGVPHEIIKGEIVNEGLVTRPWPPGFDTEHCAIMPFKVNHWLNAGDRFHADNIELDVIHTPGEAADHICLLSREDRVLFCGDILLHGEVWTHLDGGSLHDLISSYRRLMGYFDDFDYLMPGHNEPMIDKDLLPETLLSAEKVVSNEAEFEEIIDLWNRRLKHYSFGRFAITTL